MSFNLWPVCGLWATAARRLSRRSLPRYSSDTRRPEMSRRSLISIRRPRPSELASASKTLDQNEIEDLRGCLRA